MEGCGAGEGGKTTYLCKYLFSNHLILFHDVLPGIYLRSTAVGELPGNGTYTLRYCYIKKIIFDQIHVFTDK
jgi:hypothetical protein